MLRLASCKDLIDLRLKYHDHQYLYPDQSAWGLKQFGTLFCLDKIHSLNPSTILEAGAGLSPFFANHFGQQYEYWMIDQSGFYDSELFRKSMQVRKDTKYVDGLLGDFSQQLPASHFDIIFSISVLEHVPFIKMKSVFEDIHRVLKPGGFSVHTIDVNPHSPAANTKDLIQIMQEVGLEFECPPGELDWNVGRVRDPVLLEPLSIVYELYYKKSFHEPQQDPYLMCYHFGSIILCTYKPLETPHKVEHRKTTLQERINSYCTLIDQTTGKGETSPEQTQSASSYQNLLLGKYFSAIKTLLKQQSSLVYSDEGIRNFLYRTFLINPLIPKRIGGVRCDSIVPMPGVLNQKFIDTLRSSPYPITVSEFIPDLSLYRRFLQKTATFYESRFGANRLHGDGYFFQKTLEHFITFFFISQCQAEDIMDVGSAGHQYANVLRQSYPGKKVYVQDLCFPGGTKTLAEGFLQIGGSAASLPLDDASLDVVTFHCSIEHFEQDADVRCLQEIGRVLRPGGFAVIIPLHVNTEYTIAVNPVSGPFLDEKLIEEAILPELEEHDARIIYTDSMVSRFARKYSAETLISRLLSKLKGMRFELWTIEIPEEFCKEEILSDAYFNGTYRKYIPHDRRCFLKLIKQ